MRIISAEFISSHADVRKCPPTELPEFGFIGRSNVGKSSLINMLTNSRHLAKISSKPGKTQTINHFLINAEWYLVDLPGYGYASASKELRYGFGKIIQNYILKRENLCLLFILIDVRLKPQKIDLEFITWCGENSIPLSIVFTKSDKVKRNELQRNISEFKKALLERWEELPAFITTSATEKTGKDELLAAIDSGIKEYENNTRA